MSSIRPNVILYHSNDYERCNYFITKKELIYTKEDGIWLGEGMYFWDNENNANYWKSQKENWNKKNKDNKPIKIIMTGVYIDKV